MSDDVVTAKGDGNLTSAFESNYTLLRSILPVVRR